MSQPPLSPRRKGMKIPPKLPLSAFTPPNTGTSDRFPLPPSPSASHPESVFDAQVLDEPTLDRWEKEIGTILGAKASSIALSIKLQDVGKVIQGLENNPQRNKITSLIVSINLEDSAAIMAMKDLLSSASGIPISVSVVYSKSTPEIAAALREILQKGRPVDIAVETPITDVSLEIFEDLLTKATTDLDAVPPIVLSNLLPPPHDFSLPIVQLINHPTYHTFQARIAALSLFPSAYVKFLPPSWGVAIPSIPVAGTASEDSATKEHYEWKRRIKLYLGPVIEAFGFQRIVFGSCPPLLSQVESHSGKWYDMARESLAELGIDQESIDQLFSLNGKQVYGNNAA